MTSFLGRKVAILYYVYVARVQREGKLQALINKPQNTKQQNIDWKGCEKHKHASQSNMQQDE